MRCCSKADARSPQVLAVTGTEGVGRRFRFAVAPAAAAAAAEAPGTLRTRGEVVSFLDSLLAAPGGTPDAAPGAAEDDAPDVPAASPDAPRVLGRKRGLEAAEGDGDEPPAKRHEAMPPSPPRSSPPAVVVVSGDAAVSPPPPPPVFAAEIANKSFATDAEAEGAALVGRRVCRGWRIMLPDGRSSQRWCVHASLVCVVPAGMLTPMLALQARGHHRIGAARHPRAGHCVRRRQQGQHVAARREAADRRAGHRGVKHPAPRSEAHLSFRNAYAS